LKRHFDQALAAYQAQRYSDALTELQGPLQGFPNNFDVNELAGLVWVGLQQDENASGYLLKAVRLNPASAPAQTALALNLMRLRRGIEAEAHFRQAVDLDPSSYDFNHNLAEFYLQNGNLAKGIPYLRHAQQIDSRAYYNGYDLALALLETGSFDQAQDQILNLLKVRDTAELHSLLGDVEEKKKNYVAAANQYELAVRLDQSESHLFNWGAELMLHQTVGPAIEVFTEGIKRYPESARLCLALGLAEYADGHFDEGAKALCRAADLRPNDSQAYEFLGKSCQFVSADMADQVTTRLRRHLKLAPQDAAANYLLALILWYSGQHRQDAAGLAEVEPLLRNAIKLNQQYADAYLQLGQLYAGQGKFHAAIEEYTHALNINPQLADARLRLGQTLVRTGDTTRGQQELAIFERLHKQEVSDADKQRAEIQGFVYTLRRAEDETEH
jgi:tetratricopeptide (TPR) repeat protein